MPVGAGRVVPCQARRRPRAGASGDSGNANAFTGKTGRAAVKFTADLAAKAVGCRPGEVFLASTGVIGEPLNASAFDGVMETLVADAAPDPGSMPPAPS